MADCYDGVQEQVEIKFGNLLISSHIQRRPDQPDGVFLNMVTTVKRGSNPANPWTLVYQQTNDSPGGGAQTPQTQVYCVPSGLPSTYFAVGGGRYRRKKFTAKTQDPDFNAKFSVRLDRPEDSEAIYEILDDAYILGTFKDHPACELQMYQQSDESTILMYKVDNFFCHGNAEAIADMHFVNYLFLEGLNHAKLS